MRTGRIHIRLRAELARAIRAYARRRGRTLTEIVEEHFQALLVEEQAEQDRQSNTEAEQI
jgi:hypothetical protein